MVNINVENLGVASALSKLLVVLIGSAAKFYTPTDLSKEYGRTRQHWEKMMTSGRLWYYQTSGGKVTTNFHVGEYFLMYGKK